MAIVVAGAAVTVAAACCATAAAVLAGLQASSSASSSCDDQGISHGATVETSSPECAVCLSELPPPAGEEPGVRTLPGCGHGFHAECIGRWLPLRPECPLCRRPALLDDDDIAFAQPAATEASSATAAPAWARPARIACGFGAGKVVWTRSPSLQQ